MKRVVVITPTIGKPELEQAIDSVGMQETKNLVKHLIVIDGPEYYSKSLSIIDSNPNINYQLSLAPENTGKNGFYGHRIYAAYPHLVDADYIFFLDEDNWWEQNHVETLVELCESYTLEWAYSLRSVYWQGSKWEDNCESIGFWPIWFTKNQEVEDHLVDTSSFCFKREFIIKYCQNWHWGWGGDRRFYRLIKDQSKYGTTGLHTLNYRLPDMHRAYNGMLDFFDRGNEAVKKQYGGEYPWKQNLKT